MKIVFMIEQFKANQHLIDFIRDIMSKALDDYKFTENLIDYVIIADDSNFKNALIKYGNQKTYTKNEHFVAVGKIIENYNNGALTHSIVFHISVFNNVIAGMMKGSDIDKWESNEAKFHYVIYHEIAHCIDAHTRGVKKIHPLLGDDGKFRIHSVGNYYSDILLDEFYCSVLSADAMFHKAFNSDLSELKQNMTDRINDALITRKDYNKSDESLLNIAYDISGLFWFILIQYSRLIGYKIGNNKYKNLSINFLKDNIEANKLMMQFEEYLKMLWKQYPAPPSEINEQLFKIWQNFALIFGYKFETYNNGDGIFWNDDQSLNILLNNLKTFKNLWKL